MSLTINQILHKNISHDKVLQNLLFHAYENIPEDTNVLTNIALYILLCEYGYKPILHYGQISIPQLWKDNTKDHIWLTLNNQILDFGIQEYSPIVFGQQIQPTTYTLFYHHHFLTHETNSLSNIIYTTGLSLILMNPLYKMNDLLSIYLDNRFSLIKLMSSYKTIPMDVQPYSYRKLSVFENPKENGFAHIFSKTAPLGYIMKGHYLKYFDNATYTLLTDVFSRQDLESIADCIEEYEKK